VLIFFSCKSSPLAKTISFAKHTQCYQHIFCDNDLVRVAQQCSFLLATYEGSIGSVERNEIFFADFNFLGLLIRLERFFMRKFQTQKLKRAVV
jgi:hypothetical protein